MFNASKPPLDNPLVRAALAHAWDQNIIIKISSKNTVPFITHPYVGLHDCGEAGYRHYDPEEAKRLLKEYGKPVELSLIHTTTPRGREFGEVLQQLFKKVGVNLTLNPLDQNALIKGVLSYNYQISGWIFFDGVDHGPQMYSFGKSDSNYNPTRYRSSELDDLLNKQRISSDPKEREKLMCKIAEFINRSAHVLFGGGRRDHVITLPQVRNVPPIYGGISRLNRVWLDR